MPSGAGGRAAGGWGRLRRGRPQPAGAVEVRGRAGPAGRGRAYVPSSATATTTRWTGGRLGWRCRRAACASARRWLASRCFTDAPERATVYGVSYPRRVGAREPVACTFNGLSVSNAGADGFNVGLLHCQRGRTTRSHDSTMLPAQSADLADTDIGLLGAGPRSHPSGHATGAAHRGLPRQPAGPPPPRNRRAGRLPGGGGRLRRGQPGLPPGGRGALGDSGSGHRRTGQRSRNCWTP